RHSRAPPRSLRPFPTRRSSDLVDVVLEHAAVDPAAARRRAIRLHLCKARQQLPLLRAIQIVAVDFAQYVFGIWLAVFGFLVVPVDRKSTRLNSSHVSISYPVLC